MNIFGISSILVLFGNLFLTFILAKSNSRLAKSWLWVCLGATIWGTGGIMYSHMPPFEYKVVMFWWQFAYISVICTPVFFTHFVFNFLKIKRKGFLILLYILMVIFLFFNWFDGSRLFLKSLRFVFNEFYWIDPFVESNPIFLIFYIGFWWILLGYCFVLLLKEFKKSSALYRNQITYLIIGSFVGWIGPELDFLVAFRKDIYPYSNFLLFIYPFIFVYAILKFRLMDIKIAITRAGVFAFVYLFVLGIPFWIGYKYHLWQYATLVMGVLGTMGPFAFIYFNNKIEARLLKEERFAHKLLKRFSQSMIRIRNKKKLLDLINYITIKTLSLDNASVFLLEESSGNFRLSAARSKSRCSYPEIIDSDDPLINKLSGMQEPLVYEEVRLKKQELENRLNDPIHRIELQMRNLKAAVIIPAISVGRLIAFLALGEKSSKKMYSQEDLSTLWVLSSQAALAIDNAFLYDKEKRRLSEEARREAIADMAPGASHQFNNRLAAIGMTADNLLDFIKTDAKRYSKEQIIEQFSSNINIIRDEVEKGRQITEVILQKAKVKLEFDKADITKIIQNAINLTCLRRTRESLVGVKDPEFNLNYPRDLPLLNLCEGTMQDVFENIFNNAYDAIVIRAKKEIEPFSYQGKILVSISRNEDFVVITIEDNGIGIEKESLNKLFSEVFTTKTKAEKGVVGGSGLGLGVIHSFVEEHGGSIAVDSEYAKWTRFSITLPIDFKPQK